VSKPDASFDAFGVVLGVIENFDQQRGWGAMRTDSGNVYEFHCVAIADGSRTIETGQSVSAVILPGRAGRWEATRIFPRG
jgi:cold shock CspA family protein